MSRKKESDTETIHLVSHRRIKSRTSSSSSSPHMYTDKHVWSPVWSRLSVRLKNPCLSNNNSSSSTMRWNVQMFASNREHEEQRFALSLQTPPPNYCRSHTDEQCVTEMMFRVTKQRRNAFVLRTNQCSAENFPETESLSSRWQGYAYSNIILIFDARWAEIPCRKTLQTNVTDEKNFITDC